MVLRNTFFLVLFSFLLQGKDSGKIFAQDSLFSQKKYRQSVELSGEGFFTSNTITNDFILTFYKGGFIDNVLKESSTERIRTSNLFGGASKLGVTYSISRIPSAFENNRERTFSFSFFDRQHLDIKFSDDLYYTLFYGNKMFEGDTARLGNFNMNLLRYQQFRFGWSWKGDAVHGSYGVAFSLLSGEQNISVNVPKANLFTANDGTYLDFALAMNVQQTDTSNKNFFSQNGMGLSTDFYYEMPYTFLKKPGRITFEVWDLGFIRWNSNSMHYAVDSSYHYDGVNVNDILNIDNTSGSHFNLDSVIDKNTKFRKEQYTTEIPCTFDIHTKSSYGKQIAFEKGITFWFNTSAKPYYYAKLHFIFGKKKSSDVAYIFGYGGYGRFNSGLQATIDFAKSYSIQLIDNYLFSSITSNFNYGQGLYLKIVKRF